MSPDRTADTAPITPVSHAIRAALAGVLQARRLLQTVDPDRANTDDMQAAHAALEQCCQALTTHLMRRE